VLSLESILKQFLSSEQIISTGKVANYSEGTFYTIERSTTFYNGQVDFVETNSFYLFDKRQLLVKTSMKLAVIGLLLAVVSLIYLMMTSTDNRFAYIATVIFSVFSGFSFVGIFINQNLSNITIINKNWIKQNNQESGQSLLEGEVPYGESFYLVRSIQSNKQHLSILDRLQTSDLFTKLLIKTNTPFKFKIQYKLLFP
jgi:hypothetical protein